MLIRPFGSELKEQAGRSQQVREEMVMESLFEFVGLDGWTGPDRDGQVAEDSMGPVQRMGQEEEAPTTVKAWVDHNSASYWWGCLKIKCGEVRDVKSLDLPYWKKEVPVATASPPGTCASSSTPSEPVLWGNNSSEVVQGLGWF